MNLAQQVALWILKAYRLTLSPALKALFGPASGCRFEPTCSVYASQAIQTHGFVRGCWLAVKRLARCHPWATPGWDPVPKATNSRTQARDCPGCCSHHPNT
jgi:putative membrane protein insertion efficiency factor